MSQDFKVALVPCGGIGRLVSTVVRQAAYMVAGDRPDEVVIVSSASLAAGVPEALETARKYPIVIIDGCRPQCATSIASSHDLEIAATVWAPKVVAKHKLSIAGEDRKGLGDKGMKLARKIADEAVEAIDLIVAEEAMSTL
jgi:uncharacterized metal-binding protein